MSSEIAHRDGVASRKWRRLAHGRVMTSAIVISVAGNRSSFAVESCEGQCAVFCQHAGPQVSPGDVLHGAVLSRGARRLQHADGICAVVGDSGPVSRADAFALLHGQRV